jgi:hypothetical protein
MIASTFHQGSGLGNQLARYVMTRVIAMDKGYDWGMLYPQNFKGNHIWNLDMGQQVIFANADQGYPYPQPERMEEAIDYQYYENKEVNELGVNISGYDERILSGKVPDRTLIDGEFQGEKYYEHHKDKIRNWLEVEPLEMSDDLCIINFRGGEYSVFPDDLYLPQIYWDRAIQTMLKENPRMKFVVHTDDPIEARKFFPHFDIVQAMSINWMNIRWAKWLILSNSSFALLPAWLNQDVKKIIAPWGWARHNRNYWALEQNKMKGWHYQKLDGTYEVYN